MIFGVVQKPGSDVSWLDQVNGWLESTFSAEKRMIVRKGPVLLGEFGPGNTSGLRQSQEFGGAHSERMLFAWEGEIFNRTEILNSLEILAPTPPDLTDRELFIQNYRANGSNCFRELNGQFAFAVYNVGGEDVLIGRDHLGIETLFIYEDPLRYIFSSRIQPIINCPGISRELNLDALRRYLVFSYNPAWDTLICNVRKVRPGSFLRISQTGVEEIRYWQIPLHALNEGTEETIVEDLRRIIRDAVAKRMRSDRAQGAFVSGGFDSSAIACLMRELSDSQMHSFSYRCAAKSYDESAYARIVADSCHFDHHEVVFQPKDIENIKTVVQFEDEPLCNLGITVATFLLGREAHNISSRVFSGHGGDELFGGHPVYIADKMAGLADRIPRAVLYPLTAAFRRLPDSDKKLNLTVKLKRFSESLAYPAELGTYRWRIYYGQDELNLLLSPSLSLDQREFPALFSDVLDLYTEAGDRDVLNRSLYVDFQTEVGFHLRRMNLVRHFNVQPLFPLLDYRLVEYAASIPPDLKLKGYSDAKYIERKVIDGIVPDPILNRKDKIGHSIPFKNWLRAEPAVTNFVREILFDGKLSSRGYFNPTTMQQLWDDHRTAKRNNSHRLWTLCVLELWLAANNI